MYTATISKTSALPAKLTARELTQATKELLRYLEEFPQQSEFGVEEIAEWYINVVLPLEDKKLNEMMYKLCEKYYPAVLIEVRAYILG